MLLKALFVSMISVGYLFAAPQEEVACHTIGGADVGTEVIVYSNLNHAGIQHHAVVSNITIAGAKPFLEEAVTVVRSTTPGAPTKYVGNRMELTVGWTTTPTEAGEHWGTLVVKLNNGKKLSKHVLCANVQN